MKKLLLPAASFLLLSVYLSAQTKSLPVKENKYRINLPDYWGKGKKAWQVLSDKLPLICDELKDKELCGDDCNPKYTVELYITEPENLEYYTRDIPPSPYTNTRYLANNNLNKPGYSIYDYLYNPANSYYATNGGKWKVTTSYSFRCYLLLVDNDQNILSRMILVDTNETWSVTRALSTLQDGVDLSTKTPDAIIEGNKDKINPTLKELYAIIDEKILLLREDD